MRKILLLPFALAALLVFVVAFSDGSAAQAAALHPAVPTKALACTPHNYQLITWEDIYDGGVDIGRVYMYADGCGWVQATAEAWYPAGIGFINHLEIHRYSDNSLVTTASYNGSNYNETIHVDVGSTAVYAYGVVQVPVGSYWGSNRTLPTDGYV